MEHQDYKQLLSDHVVSIFKTYTKPGLHICDLATGGGKSYTIGKLTCEYYPQYFDRIIILCVQNKLVVGLNKEITTFVSTPKSKISRDDILVIENNTEVIKKAVRNKTFEELLEQISDEIENERKRGRNVNDIQWGYNSLKKAYEGIEGLIKAQDDNTKIEYIENQISECESNIRKSARSFFEVYKKYLEKTGQYKKVTYEIITGRFPALTKVYPQVEYRYKKVLLMTVHKAMYGIDPIIYEKIQLTDFADKNEKKKTLVLFDESDQAAVAMRVAIIDQAIDARKGISRFSNGYNGYLHYKSLIENPERISNTYYEGLLEEKLNKANSIIRNNWRRVFDDTVPYKNIFLAGIEDIEDYRRGVFFSGPVMKLNISQGNDKTNSYVCYKKGDRHFTLIHSAESADIMPNWDIVVPMSKFLSLAISNTTSIKSQFREIVRTSLKNRRDKFNQEEKEISKGKSSKNHYLGYPTLDGEIHTLFSRFETTSEYLYEQQLNDFITNRKNLILGKEGNSRKFPDYSVYSQGIQLYQEEIDERDNQHRVRLSCREISTTPEKIIANLISVDDISVVLCSATASCMSVVSNFDIAYLKETLRDKVHFLSEGDRDRFDKLVKATYPNKHNIEIKPLEHYVFTDKRDNKITLPEKYKNMFHEKARKAGYDKLWFRATYRDITKKKKNPEDGFFQLYRLFQFIEAYHWFITHDDIHSMIFFQNRAGDKDRDQINVLSSLIDGSFPQHSELEDDIPSDWKNEHIRISKNWEEVEGNILKELCKSKEAKLMLVTAYGSFKAGTNMQYEIPDGLDVLTGDNWESPNEKPKKDWDAVYLQSPTGYLMMNEDGNESTFEKSLYNAMLTLMMLYERGYLSKSDVAQWLRQALSGTFYFGEKSNPGIAIDKAAWAQTVVEQATGRLCRTRNKPHTTYILFDETMKDFFVPKNLQKSLTIEFKELANYILSHPTDTSNSTDDPDEIVRCNKANGAKDLLDGMRRVALRFTPHPEKYDDFDDEEDDYDSVPHIVQVNQTMNQSYKHTILMKPVIGSLEELNEEDKRLTFIEKCYADWPRNENCEIQEYYYDEKFKACPHGKGKKYPEPISPSFVRLDVLMKNPVIHEYFEKKNYATTWKCDGLILHPQILATDYAGELGEEAFKALVLKYTNCTEDKFNHLEGRDYELADFVIKNDDGTNRIAFDVKNMNPKLKHDDKKGDMPTFQKRAEKERRLGCVLITVNMLELPEQSMDDHEIPGMLDAEGKVLQHAIERIQHLIND